MTNKSNALPQTAAGDEKKFQMSQLSSRISGDEAPDDLSWTDALCADDIVPLEEAPVLNGLARTGDRVRGQPAQPPREGDNLPSGHTGIVRQIAAGFKGRPPFRKRLWVALLVETDALGPVTAFANGVEVFSSTDG